ncbi:peroxisomal carnitine O-octanoyltransferase isoform X3 [Hydra vulgaris]|uniref:Peroxisomal carnitine O-octanoyltransferase isoform X3 n=1 Tax=Hydra vulgaris TaxID=6087 RepID=A0ABM4CY86_HYDVU
MSTETLSCQQYLPSLPLPSLKDTCERYLKSVQPFLNEDEFAYTKLEVEKFQNGVGIMLHEKLIQRAKSSRNWLQFWWDSSYLEYRGPLPFVSNTAGLLQSTEWDQPKLGCQLERGALWIHFAAVNHVEIIRQCLPIGKFKNGSFQCMLQYYMHCVGRIPGEKKDIPVCHTHVVPKPDGSYNVICEVRHFVVLMKGRIFKLQVLDDSKVPYTPAEIYNQLLIIAGICKMSGDGLSIGSLTSTDRDSWYKAYTNLCELDIQNRTNISVINEAAWVVAFDDVETYTSQQAFENCALGDCVNRWFDKKTCIITATGIFGMNNDHLYIDGFVGVQVYQNIYLKCIEQKFQWKNGKLRNDIEVPYELQFVVDNHILCLVKEAQVKHRNLMASFLVIDRPIRGYGKSLCKLLNINPDHLVQIAIQLGYYRLHKKCCATYESASTRKFYSGRTGTVRSCTNETLAFARSMIDPSKTKEICKQLLMNAIKAHSTLMKNAMDGQDIDRHFFGLRKIIELEGLSLPSLFTDKAWKLSGGDCNYILSTSLSGFTYSYGGMGPMVFDGYGVFYTISDESINIVISTWKDSVQSRCEDLHNAILLSCQDIKALLSDNSKL